MSSGKSRIAWLGHDVSHDGWFVHRSGRFAGDSPFLMSESYHLIYQRAPEGCLIGMTMGISVYWCVAAIVISCKFVQQSANGGIENPPSSIELKRRT